MSRRTQLLWLGVAFVLSLNVHAGDVLYIDLNKADQEVEACQKGMASADPSETLFRISKASLTRFDENYDSTKKFSAKHIDLMLTALEEQGFKFDTIVISGDDGNGQFFGSEGYLSSDLLKKILDRHPMTKGLATTMVHNGCYAANANACENIWMKNVSPNIRTTIGFTTQAPLRTRPANIELMRDVCGKRKQISSLQKAEEYDALLRGLKGVSDLAVGICYDGGICSYDYSNNPKKPMAESCNHSYEELHRRCAQFDPGEAGFSLFQKYLNADEPGFENPQAEGDPDAPGTVSGRTPLRQYYNQLHLWRHCAADYATRAGHDMPRPGTIVRLIRFEDVKLNLVALHSEQLNQYNEKLRALGLSQFNLENLSTLSRAEINRRLVGGLMAIESQMQNPSQVLAAKAQGVKLAYVRAMAKQFDQTLRVLDPDCSHMSWVHEGSAFKSLCIANYGEEPQWPPKTKSQ